MRRNLKLDRGTYTNFIDIKVAYPNMCLDTPVSFLCEIAHNTHTKLVVWYMHSLAFIPPDNSW